MGDYRFNLTLPEDLSIAAKDEADKRGMTLTTFIRNALKVYNTLIKEERAGKKIYIGDERRIEKEIILP